MEMSFLSQEAKTRGQGMVGQVKDRNAIQPIRGQLSYRPRKMIKLH